MVLRQNVIKRIILASRILLLLSFFLPFFTFCSRREAVVDPKTYVTHQDKDTACQLIEVHYNDSEKFSSTIIGKPITIKTNLSGFEITYFTTLALKPIGSSFNDICLSYFVRIPCYLTLVLIVLAFLKKQRYKTGLILSALVFVLLSIAFVSCIIEGNAVWGFYVAVTIALINAILQWMAFRNHKEPEIVS